MTVHFVAPAIYRFGEFELDTASRELRRSGEAIELTIKAFSCVLYLIENRNRAVDRDELMLAVWGHVHLTESVLGQAIRHARQALSDSGEDQRVIKTVRGFGYRWVAPVNSSGSEAPADSAHRAAPAIAQPSTASRWRAYRLLLPLAATLAALIAIAGALRSHPKSIPAAVTADTRSTQAAAETIVLLLPVGGADGPDNAWIRLGVMDFIANRLRAAGQPMVPTDTVIMLLHGSNATPRPSDLLALTDATRARIVLEAQAEAHGHAWRVSLRSLGDMHPSLAAVGDGEDILTAARQAADRLAIALGRIPAAEPNEALALTSLVQQIHAAMLAQKPDLAQQLIQNASPGLQATPEIRYQIGRNAVYNRDLATAQTTFEALVEEVPAKRDPLLRARVLNGLGATFELHDDLERAERMYAEGARLLEQHQAPDTQDTLGSLWLNLGNIAQERRNFELARERMARARRLFESTGDAGLLAELELDLGVMDAREENYAEASHRFERAAALHAKIQNVSGELTSLSYAVETQLELLNPGAAAAVEPRMRELLSQATQPLLLVRAKLSLSNLLRANGHELAANALMNDVLAATESKADLATLRREALITRVEQTANRDTIVAEQTAGDVIQQLADDSDGIEASIRANAWRILVHADIAHGNLDAAGKAAESMMAWSRTAPMPSTRIYAALAEAELAAARGQRERADAAYERALTYADESRIPQRLLRVVESYVGWLLDQADPRVREDRVLRAVERIAEYADRDYGAAMVRLRVYRALGPPAAGKSALEGAKTLAGERPVPADLQPPP